MLPTFSQSQHRQNNTYKLVQYAVSEGFSVKKSLNIQCPELPPADTTDFMFLDRGLRDILSSFNFIC